MPNTEKARAGGKRNTLSQPTNTASSQSPTDVTPGKHRSTPVTKHQAGTGVAMSNVGSADMTRLLGRFDILESTIRENKEASNALTAQTNKDLAEIKDLLKIAHDKQQAVRRKLLVAELNLKAVTALNNKLNERLNELENQSKICNIRLDGKAEEEGEDLISYINDLALFLNHNSQSGPKLVSVYRMGKKPTYAGAAINNTGRRPYRPRTILITFSSISDRNTFYFARTKLKGSLDYGGIYLNDDVTVDTRKAREDYRSVAALARLNGVAVKIHSDGVVLDGTKYKLFEADSLPPCYSLAKAKTLEFGGEIFFQSRHSFLSNFHDAPILYRDQMYPTAEHLYQAEKCLEASENGNHGKILLAATPLEAKRIGDLVNETAEWRQNKEQIMTRIVDLKFDQNPILAELLIKTGEKTLNEATSNTFFGIGATLHSKEIKEKSYRGSNKLGQIIMAKRQRLIADRKPTSD